LLLDRPYTERRARLDALDLAGPHWQVPPAHGGDGHAVLEASREQGMEGVVAKWADSRYEPGVRSRHWLKIRHHCRQEFVVGGWLPGKGIRERRVGALLVGYWEDGDDGRVLRFAGAVGSGYTDAELDALAGLLAPLRRATSPFDVARPRPQAVFVEPELVVEVEFTEWTHTDTLRQPVYKGRRPDKDAADVRRET
jgi:bifunctional non-homologous end joining protein LigD